MHDKISLSCAQSSSIPISKVYLYGSFLRYNEIVKSTVYREQNLHLVKMSNARELAEIHIQDTNLKLEREARSWYVLFFHCKNSFLFNTIVPFFFHCWNSLSSILALLSFYHWNFFFDVRTALFFFFKFPSPPSSFTNSFHPLNFSFSFVLFSTAFSTKFLFFRIFRFPSLRIRISLLSSLNFLPRVKGKIKKKNPYDYTYYRKYPIPKFIAIKLIPEEKLSRETTDRLLIRYSWYPTPKWNWKP